MKLISQSVPRLWRMSEQRDEKKRSKVTVQVTPRTTPRAVDRSTPNARDSDLEAERAAMLDEHRRVSKG